MELTNRQELILNSLIQSYIDSASPVSSNLLKEKINLDVSPATIRNDLQELTEQGYVEQPHTSAGRVPTEKGYKYFIEIVFFKKEEIFPNFIIKEIEEAQKKIEKELQLAKELTKSLTEISTTLSYTRIQKKSFDSTRDRDTIFEMLKIIGPSRNTYDKNISLISELLAKLESF